MYGFTLQLKMSFDASIAKVTEALKQHGFGVLANIDVKATLKAKLNIKRPPYRILGACNRPLSPRAIEADSTSVRCYRTTWSCAKKPMGP